MAQDMRYYVHERRRIWFCRCCDNDSGNSSSIKRQQHYTYNRVNLISILQDVTVWAFQISQLIRLLIRDKQTNPFKYQTVLIGASRTYGDPYLASLLNANTKHVVFRAVMWMYESILYIADKPSMASATKNKHMYNKSTQPYDCNMSSWNDLFLLFHFFPRSSFSLTFFLLPVFPLIAFFTFGYVVLCYWGWLLFNYCSLKYYMLLCAVVVVTMCVCTVSQFLRGEKKMRNIWTNARELWLSGGLRMQHGYYFLD